MSVNNILKTFMYIYPITKQRIDFNGNTWDPIKSIYLRESLFCKDECLVCGRCCIYEPNIFLPFEVDSIKDVLISKTIDTTTHKLNGRGYSNLTELLDSLVEFSVVINNKHYVLYKSQLPKKVYTIPDRGTIERCHWLLPTEDNRLGCGIHSVESLTCRMPHIRFFYNKEKLSTSIGHSNYGRNWALKCPSNVSKTNFSLDTLNTVISNFSLLDKYCKYFDIETYCPEILNYLHRVKKNGIIEMHNICDKNIIVKTPFSQGELF